MNRTAKLTLATGALSGLLVMIAGAYGAHVLGDAPGASLLQTAIQYHMFHTLGLLAIGAVAAARGPTALLAWAAAVMLLGIVLFCGSLYVHALTGYRGLVMFAPFGGISLMLSWVLLALAAWRL